MDTLELEKNYRPEVVEDKWYKTWEDKKKFAAYVDYNKKPYCIVIPPPNITGSLHIGHALNNTLQDILIRMKRMQGYSSLWIPGTDHAGIATQRVVEKDLLKEGKTRWDIGRDKFIERVWEWKEIYGSTIINQLKRMGCSCDWDRLRFTLDEWCSKAVREAFVHLYNKGWIYRGKRIINWCTRCHTALSDLEVEHEAKKGKLYYVRYFAEIGDGGITIATTRPETILADTAVAVNPKDPRFEHLIGKNVILPVIGRKIPVIADSYVDMEFGTGALKITPAHDVNDYEVGLRHNLGSICVIDENGTMNSEAGKYAGMDRFEARDVIVKDLETLGNLVKIEDYDMGLGTCYRCHNVIEPYLSEQWFVKMSELADPAIKAVEDGRTRFIPERFANGYLDWMRNLRDWCISRQLWWGHRIPVWKCEDCGYEAAFKEDPNKCPKCGSPRFIQDEYALDTWFSSGLWPLSTLGWPEKTPELDYFYPTSVLSTARDIINLWVARMMMFGLEFKNDVPFDDVFIHATVMNKEGKRMSKSLGTGIDPLDLFDKYGTDATRFGLTIMTEQGQDIKFSEERMEMSRNFANKIWNASRYLLKFLTSSHINHKKEEFELEVQDRWILSRLNSTIAEVTKNYENYEFDLAAKNIYMFFWDDFCDWYIEITKPILYGENESAKTRTLWILETIMDRFLRISHPVMPFISEEIWSFLPANRKNPENLLISAPWPQADDSLIDKDAERGFAIVMEVIKGLRNMRAEVGLTPKQTAKFEIETADESGFSLIETARPIIENIAGAENLNISVKSGREHHKSLSARVGDFDLFMPIEGLIDIDKELNRLESERQRIEKGVTDLARKCENPNFLEKARPDVVENEMARLSDLKEQLRRIEDRIKLFK